MALSKETKKVLRLLARRGATEVLAALERGPARFSELEEALYLSPRTLAERLRELHLTGLVGRRAYPEVPPRVEYTLTPRGERVLGFVLGLEGILNPLEEAR